MRSALIALVLIAGCGTPTGPALDHFEFYRDQELDTAVRVDVGAVTIEGSFSTPCIPYEIHGDVEVGEGVVTLVVVGEDEDDSCPMDAIGQLGYRAVIDGLRAGEWTVRVIHRWADAGWPEVTVVDQSVRIGQAGGGAR